MLDYNQYPSYWYETIIHKTLEKIRIGPKKVEAEPEESKKMVFIEYRGKITDQYVKKPDFFWCSYKANNHITKNKNSTPIPEDTCRECHH